MRISNLIKLISKKYLLVFIICLAIYSRFINLDKTFVFGVDEEYQAYLARTIVENFHLIWIGVGSTVGFYLGPFWTYLTAGLLFLSKGDPLITGFFSAGLGIISTFLVYLISRNIFNNLSGLVVTLLYSCLPLIVFYDKKYWNVTAIPIIVLLLFWSAIKSKINPNWLAIFFLAFRLIFHIHLTLLPIALVCLYWIINQKIFFPKQLIIISLTIFTLTISPLIIFDYFHKLSNLSAPFRLFQSVGKNTSQFSFYQHQKAFFESLGRFWYLSPNQNLTDEINWGCTSTGNLKSKPSLEDIKYWSLIDKLTSRDTPNILLSVWGLLVLLVFLLLKRTWKNNNTRLLGLLIITQSILFLFFPGPAFEYYLLTFFTLYFLIIGQVIYTTNRLFKRVLIIVFISFAIMGIYTVTSVKEEYGLANKKKLITQISNAVNDKPFVLKEGGMCHIAEGWRYLFSVYGTKPIYSSTDQMFGWIYPAEINKQITPFYEVVMSESRVPFLTNKRTYKRFEEGGFTGYIIKL